MIMISLNHAVIDQCVLKILGLILIFNVLLMDG